MLHDDILSTIGNTPIVRLNNILALDNKQRIYAKIEFTNPTGSIKDRAALYMLKDAMERGVITKDTVIIEPTSGNTGIGLAMACAVYKMSLILTMPENMSIERQKILKAYGAKIVLTDKALGMQGAIDRANELKTEIPDSYIPSQFENPSNRRAHYMTTAPEIFNDLPSVSAIVAGVGSGGTIMGIADWVREKGKDCKIIAVEPSDSAVMSGGKASPHKLQGIGAGFVTPLTDVDVFDKIVTITTDEAYEYSRRLAKEEGIFAGITAGANLCAGIKISNEIKGDILVIIPDTGMRYLSGDLYE